MQTHDTSDLRIHAIWDKDFSNIRDLRERKPYVEVVREAGFDGDCIDPLLKDDTHNTFSDSQIKLIRKLCPSSILNSLTSGISSPGGPNISRLGVWLDDRMVDAAGRMRFRPYVNPLSAHQFYLMLEVDRFDHEDLPDADRRLILIEKLDGPMIFALQETVRYSELCLLREAISAHLGFDVNFSATVLPRDKIFCVKIHITLWVVLSEVSKDQKPDGLPWLDNSFMNLPKSDQKEGRIGGMYKARFTITMCGTAYARYTVWAFADHLSGVPSEETIEDHSAEDNFPYPDPVTGVTLLPHEDPICPWSGETVDANLPVMDVREYGLLILENHLRRLLKHWKDVQHAIKPLVERFLDSVNNAWAESGSKSTRNQKKSSNKASWRTHNWIERLSILEDDLAQTIDKLHVFCFESEGFEFLLKRPLSRTTHYRKYVIEQTFYQFEDVKKKLGQWLESFNRIKIKLDRDMNAEANKRNSDYGKIAMNTFRYITPPALSIALCSMNKEVIPFTLTKWLFPVVVATIFFVFSVMELVNSAWVSRSVRKKDSMKSPEEIDSGRSRYSLHKVGSCSSEVESNYLNLV